jgi:hypothetical protein
VISEDDVFTGIAKTYWQSMRSVIPPWPGIECPKSLMLKARLKPDAKNPPNGATSEAKVAITSAWIWNGAHEIDGADRPSCDMSAMSLQWYAIDSPLSARYA